MFRLLPGNGHNVNKGAELIFVEEKEKKMVSELCPSLAWRTSRDRLLHKTAAQALVWLDT
jgi:hypothetical protein